MSIEKYLINKIQPPALPVSPPNPLRGYLDDLNNILRLFFARAANNINLLTGSNGGRFIDSPNGLFWDDDDQPLDTINVEQPVRFNQTYLNNGMTINGPTTSQITMTYSGIYNFQFNAMLRSSSANSKIAYIWIARNGTNIGYTAREYLISGSGGVLEINWNFNIDMQAGQYIEIMWTGDNIDLSLDAVAPTSPHPGIPSAVIAVTFVSVLPDTLPTPP
jgi:hypothetical protein